MWNIIKSLVFPHQKWRLMPRRIILGGREGPTQWWFYLNEQTTPLIFFEKVIEFIIQKGTQKTFLLVFAFNLTATADFCPQRLGREKVGLLPYADFMMMIRYYIGKLTRPTYRLQQRGKSPSLFSTSWHGCSPAAGFDKLVEMGLCQAGYFGGTKQILRRWTSCANRLLNGRRKIQSRNCQSCPHLQTDSNGYLADLVG